MRKWRVKMIYTLIYTICIFKAEIFITNMRIWEDCIDCRSCVACSRSRHGSIVGVQSIEVDCSGLQGIFGSNIFAVFNSRDNFAVDTEMGDIEAVTFKTSMVLSKEGSILRGEIAKCVVVDIVGNVGQRSIGDMGGSLGIVQVTRAEVVVAQTNIGTSS
jgi:hypothetical protein